MSHSNLPYLLRSCLLSNFASVHSNASRMNGAGYVKLRVLANNTLLANLLRQDLTPSNEPIG